MLIAIIGENCVGKSTLANRINEKMAAKIYSGKDYLRLEKNPSAALEKFRAILKEAVVGDKADEALVYSTDPEVEVEETIETEETAE